MSAHTKLRTSPAPSSCTYWWCYMQGVYTYTCTERNYNLEKAEQQILFYINCPCTSLRCWERNWKIIGIWTQELQNTSQMNLPLSHYATEPLSPGQTSGTHIAIQCSAKFCFSLNSWIILGEFELCKMDNPIVTEDLILQTGLRAWVD